MSEHPQLQDFLEDQADDGRSLGEADFTVDRDSALAKLAHHSLPFPGAWLLKAVQTAVTCGCREGITVTATRRQTVVRFDTERSWESSEVRQAFLDPDPCADPVLGHLKFALWGAGISGNHPFELTLPGQWNKLVWEGEELREQPSEQLSRKLVLCVEHRKLAEEKPGFFAQRRLASRINSENSIALANNAYTCPVPLTLDGRRLDSLFLAPLYFHGNIAQPIELSFLERGGPPMGLPRGTFEGFRRRKWDYKPGAIDQLAEDAADAAPVMERAAVALVYAAHLGTRHSGKHVTWATSSSKSHLFWVKDGVLVRREVFPMEPTALSFACYCSADGLAMDLTTLQLVASSQKEERTSEVTRAVSVDLLKPRDFDFDGVLATARREDRMGGMACYFMGTFTIIAVPLGLFFLWLGTKQFREAGLEMRTLVGKVRDGYPELQYRWCQSHARFLPEGTVLPPPPLPPAEIES